MVSILAKAALICSFISLISATDYPCHKPTTTQPPPPTCGPNQKYTDCENHPCRDTCDNPNLSKVCTYAPGKYPGCICVDGYVKDNDGTCLKREICDITCSDPNAEVQSFPNICPDGGTCANPEPGLCRIAFPRKGCHCKPGYVKDVNGKCILLSQCPPKCTIPNEVPILGGGIVKENTCESGFQLDASKCRCADGFVRHEGKCIKPCDCPKCTKPREIFKYCGSTCPATCKNKEGEKPCGTPCVKSCVIGCFCGPEYVRSDKGDCILPTECHACSYPYARRCILPTKPCCGKNEEFRNDAPIHPRACDNLYEELCQDTKPGCACKEGFVRESSAIGAKCIKQCHCPPCYY